MLATLQELFPSNAQELLEECGISRVGLPYTEEDVSNDRNEPIANERQRTKQTQEFGRSYESPVLIALLKSILRRSQGGMSAFIALWTMRR
jgi:hypothetical protein